MLRNNEFGIGHLMTGQANEVSSNINADKYVNDYRLLDIRCGVLEEERYSYNY